LQQKNIKANRPLPLTAQRVRELLDYNPETGVLRWRIKRGKRLAGSIIATRLAGDRYTYVGLDYRTYYAHRAIWLMQTGQWPECKIDHRDGNPRNNRWANLRHATHAQNVYNRRRQRNNKSGFKGVTLHKPTNRWRSTIAVGGKQISLGYRDTPELAHAAYARAARIHHGEFARAA
jgi:hypothetical protein